MFNQNATVLSCILATSLLLTVHSNADMIVYDNGVGGAAGIDTVFASDSAGGQLIADDVTLGVTTDITGIEWTGIYGFTGAVPAIDDFTIRVFADDSGLAMGGAPLASFNVGNAVNRVDTGVDIFAQDVYEYSANINFTMNAGVTYWVSVDGNTVSDLTYVFLWGSDSAGVQSLSTDGAATWVGNTGESDFRLSAIPEPASIGLFGIGLISAAALRKNRKNVVA